MKRQQNFFEIPTTFFHGDQQQFIWFNAMKSSAHLYKRKY